MVILSLNLSHQPHKAIKPLFSKAPGSFVSHALVLHGWELPRSCSSNFMHGARVSNGQGLAGAGFSIAALVTENHLSLI